MKNILITLVLIVISMQVIAQGPPSNAVNADSLAKQIEKNSSDIAGLKRVKVSGYIQAQYQLADSMGQPSFAGGNFASGVDNRFMIRRGRIKFQYNSAPNKKGINISEYMLQFDVTERGVTIKDAVVRLTDPVTGWFSVSAGMFNNPFGYEITYSSSRRESPERGRMSQTLFPNEREVGGMLTVQGPSKSKWNWITLHAGFFNGNSAPGFGVDVSDFDSKKDFSGRLGIERSTKSDKVSYGAAVSYYAGGFRIDSVTVYKSATDENGVKGFVIDSKAIDNGPIDIEKREFTKRNYIGADARVSIKWKAGTTTLRGEFIAGDQPGSSSSTRSPNDKNPITRDIYQRSFNGAYFYFVQDILKTPFQLVVKYDWYDPNTDVKGDEVGKSVSASSRATGEADLRYDTYGFGLNYHFDKNIRVMAYYDFVKNETTANLNNFNNDRPDNVFTLRLQARF
jgi:hypothetical protein